MMQKPNNLTSPRIHVCAPLRTLIVAAQIFVLTALVGDILAKEGNSVLTMVTLSYQMMYQFDCS